MATQTKRNDIVAQLEEEITRLEEQQTSALAESEAADHKLEDIHSRSVALAPAAFSGETKAEEELAALEAEAAALSRTIRVAKDAASEFEKVIGATKEELAGERRLIARERFEELRRERAALGEEAEEAMEALIETLSKYGAL